MDDCVFCRIIKGELPAKRLGENEGAIAFPDIRPLMPVHVLVVPRRHVASLDEVGDGSVMGPVFGLAAQVAKEHGLDETGWRAVVNTGRDANQVVFHVHVHVFGGRSMGWPPF